MAALHTQRSWLNKANLARLILLKTWQLRKWHHWNQLPPELPVLGRNNSRNRFIITTPFIEGCLPARAPPPLLPCCQVSINLLNPTSALRGHYHDYYPHFTGGINWSLERGSVASWGTALRKIRCYPRSLSVWPDLEKGSLRMWLRVEMEKSSWIIWWALNAITSALLIRKKQGTSLGVQWLGLVFPLQGGTGEPWSGKIPQTVWWGQKKKEKKKETERDFTYTEEKTTWRQRQRPELCSHKSGTSGAIRNQKRQGTNSPLGPSQHVQRWHLDFGPEIQISDFWPPDCGRINFRCLKLASLWSFVTAATGNLYRSMAHGHTAMKWLKT